MIDKVVEWLDCNILAITIFLIISSVVGLMLRVVQPEDWHVALYAYIPLVVYVVFRLFVYPCMKSK